MGDMIILMVLTNVACTVIGLLLILKNQSMLADAIAHSVLLGIVLAFMVIGKIDSIWLVVSAGIFGVITIVLIESLERTNLLKSDASTGLIFSFMFALSIILITRYLSNSQLSTEVVLMGNIIFETFNTFADTNIIKGYISISIMLIINLIFICVFFKEIKLSLFDPKQAHIAGFSVVFFNYAIMTLASFTAVIAFDIVGAILVISSFITPAATAYLLTKDFKWTLALSIVIAIFDAVIGVVIAYFMNLSVSGVTAFVSGAIFVLVWIFAKDGVIVSQIKRTITKVELKKGVYMLHIKNHMQYSSIDDGSVDRANEHLGWKDSTLKKYTNTLLNKNYIKVVNNKYKLTEKGDKYCIDLEQTYGLDKNKTK